MMKIAMIGHKDFPSRAGGVEVVVYELATRLVRRGHRVTVFNRGRQSGHNHYMEDGVEVIRCFTVKMQSLNAFLYSFTATITALSKGFDVFHYHAIGPSVPLVIPHLLGRKCVATVHGLNWQINRWNRFAAWYLRLGEGIIAKYADEIIVLSQEAKEYFRTRYGRETTLIRNAVTPVEYRSPELIKQKYGLENQGYILFLARLGPEKGAHYLIEAYKKLDTDKKLVIAGEIPRNEYGSRLLEMTRDNPDIIMTGFVSGRLMEELFCSAALYVLPSETEGLALSLLEAMSAGVRCLTSDIPENTAVTGSFGRSFVSKDPDSLARQLELCLSEPPDRALLARQKAYILREYSYDKTILKTETVYKNTIGN